MIWWITFKNLFGNFFCQLKLFFIVFLCLFIFSSKNRALAISTPKVSSSPYIVIIDPGHGGSDHGATTELELSEQNKKQIIYEKDLALGIALRVGRVLNDPKYWSPLNRRVKVIFSRIKDEEVSLEDRSKIAKKNTADLFVSIHLNSESSGKVSGIETYFLNNTDNASNKKLAEIENKSSRKYASIKPESLILRSVAADAVVESSRRAAEFIHNSLLQHLESLEVPQKNRGVKQALLYVLLDAQTPAVLLEPLFLSNKKDALFLTQAENRQKFAEGIAIGILRYLALR